ncbi:hypothetical protein EG68_06262 [Paragonimus skrjabini miyazakii]|uniref:Uncharacterized protein n=1 Tax=Paragonimus skrjabini miyazakii TaxID=59628 RepID=A0A8S9YVB0_9TREM|nr:hypothetical protein EG68_06262 [Paragonimus skrjabini miyazakii]
MQLKYIISTTEGPELLQQYDKDGNGPVNHAVRVGRLDLVRIIIESNSNWLTTDPFKRACREAASKGQIDLVRYLLKQNKSYAYVTNMANYILLHHAAEEGWSKIVSLLVDQFPNSTHRKNAKGQVPLQCAVNKNQLNCAKILLKAEPANVNSKDSSGCTALFIACEKGFTNMVKLLLDSDADPRLITYDKQRTKWDALSAALINKHTECARIIFENKHCDELLKNRMVDLDGNAQTHFTIAIQKLPEMALLIMDKCIKSCDMHCDDPEYTIRYNFELLYGDTFDGNPFSEYGATFARFYNNISTTNCASAKTASNSSIQHKTNEEALEPENKMPKSLHPLEIMLKSNREDLLQHDLVRAFLAHKSARLFIPFLTSFIFYALLLAIYSVYMFQNTPPYMYFSHTRTSGLEYEATNETRNLQKLCSLLKPATRTTELSKYGLMCLALLSLLKEVTQFMLYKRNYITWENAVEISIYVLALLITIDTNECMHITGLREH